MKGVVFLFLASLSIDFVGNKIIILQDGVRKECEVDQKLINSGDADAILKNLRCVEVEYEVQQG